MPPAQDVPRSTELVLVRNGAWVMRHVAFAAAVLLFSVQASAGTITQSVSFHFAPHGTIYFVYNQFDPALGPLNGVATTVSIRGSGESYTLMNSSQNAISFNAIYVASVSTDAGLVYLVSGTIPLTLGEASTPA